MKHLFLLLTLLSFSLTALAQQKVTGKVKDSSGEPVIGASVVVKGNNTMGTITDFDGNFMLDVPTKSVLVISYIGLANQTEKNNVNTLDCNDDFISDDDTASDMDYCRFRRCALFVGIVAVYSRFRVDFAARLAGV